MKPILTKDEFDAAGNGVFLITQPSQCVPCRRFAPVYERVDESFEGQIDFYKINIDEIVAAGLHPGWVLDLGVRAVPFVFIRWGGTRTDLKQRAQLPLTDEILAVVDNEPPF